MPQRPPRICSCGRKVPSGQKCPCQVARQQTYDRERGTSAQRGYDSKWQRASREFLALPGNEFCACGCGRRADMVDHKIAHKGDKKLFWDRKNWQPFASYCNRRKNAKYEGGFGNPVRQYP